MLARTISHVAERAATESFPNLTLWKKVTVASVKHCSILALDVLCFRLFKREDQRMQTEKRSERKRCMPWQMTD